MYIAGDSRWKSSSQCYSSISFVITQWCVLSVSLVRHLASAGCRVPIVLMAFPVSLLWSWWCSMAKWITWRHTVVNNPISRATESPCLGILQDSCPDSLRWIIRYESWSRNPMDLGTLGDPFSVEPICKLYSTSTYMRYRSFCQSDQDCFKDNRLHWQKLSVVVCSVSSTRSPMLLPGRLCRGLRVIRYLHAVEIRGNVIYYTRVSNLSRFSTKYILLK